MKNGPFVVAARIALAFLLTQGLAAEGAEIKLFSVPALRPVLHELGPQFERSTGHALVIKFEFVPVVIRQIEAGGTFDLAILEPYAIDKRTRVAVYGTGEAAELAYLSIAGLGLEMVAVFDRVPSGRFLGRPVRDISDHREVAFDVLLVATLEQSQSIVEDLVRLGISHERLVTLRR